MLGKMLSKDHITQQNTSLDCVWCEIDGELNMESE